MVSGERIRVLIVDDSVTFRSALRGALEGHPRIEVVGVASNGALALQRLRQMRVDLVVLNLEMPELDGLETLRQMREQGCKQKVIIFSTHSQAGASATLEALAAGASEFESKPEGEPGCPPAEVIRKALLPKILNLFPQSPTVPPPATTPAPAQPPAQAVSATLDLIRPRVILIGSSTGGPNALEEVFSKIRVKPSCPILIVQHMPPIFTGMLAERLQRVSGIPAREARGGERPLPGHVYIAPGNFHLRVKATEEGPILTLDQEPQENSVRPAVDPLFTSAAECFGAGCMAIVLTGMGNDGRLGAEAIERAGGMVLIQSRESCVVFGMPGAVYSSGAYDRIGDLSEIAEAIRTKAAA